MFGTIFDKKTTKRQQKDDNKTTMQTDIINQLKLAKPDTPWYTVFGDIYEFMKIDFNHVPFYSSLIEWLQRQQQYYQEATYCDICKIYMGSVRVPSVRAAFLSMPTIRVVCGKIGAVIGAINGLHRNNRSYILIQGDANRLGGEFSVGARNYNAEMSLLERTRQVYWMLKEGITFVHNPPISTTAFCHFPVNLMDGGKAVANFFAVSDLSGMEPKRRDAVCRKEQRDVMVNFISAAQIYTDFDEDDNGIYIHTIVFTGIGTGDFQHPSGIVYQTMLDTIADYGNIGHDLKFIFVEPDADKMDEFINVAKSAAFEVKVMNV